MRRLPRNTLHPLCLLPCVAFLALWARSPVVHAESIVWTDFNDAQRTTRGLTVTSADGAVVVLWDWGWYPEMLPPDWGAFRHNSRPAGVDYERGRTPPTTDAWWRAVDFPNRHEMLGFGWIRNRYYAALPSDGRTVRMLTATNWVLQVPYWSLVALTALPPAWLDHRARRRCRLARRGVCTKCGYDLRESPDRCPECGLAKPVV
jgi:hypothetical protein